MFVFAIKYKQVYKQAYKYNLTKTMTENNLSANKNTVVYLQKTHFKIVTNY